MELPIPNEFRAIPWGRVNPLIIPDMILECVKILDPSINVEFVDFDELPSLLAAKADPKVKKIVLQKTGVSVLDIKTSLFYALHEIAHIWFSDHEFPHGLNEREYISLDLLEDIRANCKTHSLR